MQHAHDIPYRNILAYDIANRGPVHYIFPRGVVMFIARENELNVLEGRYSSDHFEFAMIYGRRRIGKTRLIEEFVKNKKCIFFSAMKDGSRHESLVQLSKCVTAPLGEPRGFHGVSMFLS